MPRVLRCLKLVGIGCAVVALLLTGAVVAWFVPWDDAVYPDGSPKLEPAGANTVILYSPAGAVAYRGEWRDGRPDGNGESYYTSRLRAGNVEYSGQWRQGLYHGYGQLYHAATGQLMYSGQWHSGLRHGQGEEFNTEGALRFQGEWLYGLRHGLGSQYRNGRLVYHGQWRNGLPNGHGEAYYPDGSLFYQGTWKDGRYLRPDKVFLPDGSQLCPAGSYVYIWALERGLEPERALGFWRQAAELEPHISPVTDDPWQQAILYNLAELSAQYPHWLDSPPPDLHMSLKELASLPPSVAEGLVLHGCRTRFLMGQLIDEPDLADLDEEISAASLGIASRDRRLAVARLDSETPVRVTLHEAGHLVDFLLVEWNEELILDLRDRRQQEGHKLFTAYYYNSQREYFAEFFAHYFLSAEHWGILPQATLTERAPKTYEFFQELYGIPLSGLAEPRDMTVEFALASGPNGGQQELIVAADPAVSDLYLTCYHSSYEQLAAAGWNIRMFLELLTRPSNLVEPGATFIPQAGCHVLYFALDEAGNYAVGSWETIKPSFVDPDTEPVFIQQLTLAEKLKAGFANMFRSFRGLVGN